MQQELSGRSPAGGIEVRVMRKDLASASKYDRVDVRTSNDGSKEVVAIVFKGAIESFLVADNAGVALVDKP